MADFFDSALIDSGLSLSTASSAEEPWELVYESISTTGSGNYSWNEVDFVGDVLINRDLNLDPLSILKQNVELLVRLLIKTWYSYLLKYFCLFHYLVSG